MVDREEMDSAAEQWQGLTVRARDGNVLGIVVGVFAEGPLAGRLRVHGDYTVTRHQTGPQDGTAVYAIPHRAVVRRGRHSLVLDATLGQARGAWLMHVLQSKQAAPPPGALPLTTGAPGATVPQTPATHTDLRSRRAALVLGGLGVTLVVVALLAMAVGVLLRRKKEAFAF